MTDPDQHAFIKNMQVASAAAAVGVQLDLADMRRLVVALRIVVWRVADLGVDEDGWRRV